MMTAELPVRSPATSLDDELMQLELRVARRADELARGIDFSRVKDMLIWFQAEREILGYTNEQGPVSLMPAR